MFLVAYVLATPCFPTSDLLMALPPSEISPLQSLPAENLIHHHCKLDVTISVELLRYPLPWIPQIILDEALSLGAFYFVSGYYLVGASPSTVFRHLMDRTRPYSFWILLCGTVDQTLGICCNASTKPQSKTRFKKKVTLLL